MGSEDELPLLQLLGLARTNRGWCVVEVITQGKTVIDTELLFGPDTKAACADQLKVEFERVVTGRRRPTNPQGLN